MEVGKEGERNEMKAVREGTNERREGGGKENSETRGIQYFRVELWCSRDVATSFQKTNTYFCRAL